MNIDFNAFATIALGVAVGKFTAFLMQELYYISTFKIRNKTKYDPET